MCPFVETVHAIVLSHEMGRNLHSGRACFFSIESLLGPEAEAPPAQLVGLAGHPPHLGAAPVEGELAEAVDEALLLDHGQVALPLAARLVAAVVVPHRPRHLKARKLVGYLIVGGDCPYCR